MDLKTRFQATIILHALGDTIGFRNGKWEFFGMSEFTKTHKLNFNLANEILYEFISLGGINGIDLKNWFVSDDTLLHMNIIESLIETDDLHDMCKSVTQKFIKTKFKYFDNRININREPGITTLKSIDNLENNVKSEYDPHSGGNGAAMRSIALGLIFYNDLDKLINYSIETAKLTHNSAIGYLGSLTSAYFVYLAINNINLHSWPQKLINLLENLNIQKKITNKIELADYKLYISKWKKYIELRFDDTGKPMLRRSAINIVFRIQFYYDNFIDLNYGFIPGASGYLVNIMAYDALLDAENKWEKLVVYSMLHLGDSDTVGCIAAGWYGALYGFGDVPKKNLENIEFSEQLYKLSKKLYTKACEKVI